MSSLDQPLLIANSNYHVGQQMSVRIAEEQGFFRQEGLTEHIYECRGLIPGPLEGEGLALTMAERGVDIATAVNVDSALRQRSRGAEVFIVGGWRFTPNLKFFGGKHIRQLSDLRGKRIGTREEGGLDQLFVANQLRRAGLDPARDVTWVYDAVFSYGNNPEHLEMLRQGRVDGMSSQPPSTDQLAQEGFPLLLDPVKLYPGGRPDKVIVATGQTVERRGDELRAFLRANIRGFWWMRDLARYDYLRDLEARLRQATHNEHERRVSIITSPLKVEGWTVPVDGGVSRGTLKAVIDELRAAGGLPAPLAVDNVLRDAPVLDAFEDLRHRPESQPLLDKLALAVEKYGF